MAAGCRGGLPSRSTGGRRAARAHRDGPASGRSEGACRGAPAPARPHRSQGARPARAGAPGHGRRTRPPRRRGTGPPRADRCVQEGSGAPGGRPDSRCHRRDRRRRRARGGESRERRRRRAQRGARGALRARARGPRAGRDPRRLRSPVPQHRQPRPDAPPRLRKAEDGVRERLRTRRRPGGRGLRRVRGAARAVA